MTNALITVENRIITTYLRMRRLSRRSKGLAMSLRADVARSVARSAPDYAQNSTKLTEPKAQKTYSLRNNA
jgi:hypothetical protein